MPLSHHYSAWVEINLAALRSNFRAIKRLTRRQEVEQRRAAHVPAQHIRTPLILPVVKADAYGHGMLAAARELTALGADFLAVSDFREGITLRQNGITLPILVMEPPLPSAACQLLEYDLITTVCSLPSAIALDRCAASREVKARVHIKIDTGMGRLGVWQDEAMDLIDRVMRLEHLDVQGLYTHFPSADTDPKLTQDQIDRMKSLVERLDHRGRVIPYIHGANSMGTAGYPTRIFNVVRPGLMLYGLYPSREAQRIVSLRPVMSVKARVIFVKDVPKGRGISYGQTFVAKKPMRMATISIGYNDGFTRALSNKAEVLIGGRRCRVLGRVTMDQTVVDVTHVPRARIGSEVVVIGRQGREMILADELAAHAGTINYEIVCSLGNRLPRVYKS